jgi:hypothetical protein
MASTEPTSRIHPYIHIPVIIWQVPFSHASQFYSFHFFSELGYNLWTEELHVPLCGDVKDIMSHIELNASCDTCECMLGWVSDSEDMLQCSTVPWCKNHKKHSKYIKIYQNGHELFIVVLGSRHGFARFRQFVNSARSPRTRPCQAHLAIGAPHLMSPMSPMSPMCVICVICVKVSFCICTPYLATVHWNATDYFWFCKRCYGSNVQDKVTVAICIELLE